MFSVTDTHASMDLSSKLYGITDILNSVLKVRIKMG